MFRKKLFIKISDLLLFIPIWGLFINGCKESSDEFILGEEYIESQTNLTLIDTFSVNLSTVILDDVVTSGTETLLIGSFSDDILGKITSHSYFQIGIPDSLDYYDTENDDVYDSLSLMLLYNKYFWGDTTKRQEISVYQLSEKIELNENNYLTSNTSFNYNPDPIGLIDFYPQPNSTMDTLFIKIDDAIGNGLFSLLKEDSDILSSDENFINYFPGFVLLANEMYKGSIVGFNATSDDLKLILYTHRSDLNTGKINYGFSMENSEKQFNNIIHDFASTQLNPLTSQRDKLPNSQTGGLSFLQGGTGLVIRADFPSLQNLLLLDRGLVTKAELLITPLKNSYNNQTLPADLYVYESDKINRIIATGGNPSVRYLDELYKENTSYSFDITEYLTDELSDSYIDPEKGLLITLSQTNESSSFYRLIVDASRQKTKLKIYYLYY